MFVLSDYVDLGRYPIDRRGGDAYNAVLASPRTALAHDGCAVLSGFVHAEGVEALAREEEEEGGFPWHFDTNNYTVTLALQNAEGGGVFEYCPNLRKNCDENYEGVARVLNGNSDEVVGLPLGAGDLQIFRGRYSLHRVTPVPGSRPRYVAIFSVASVPDMVAPPERSRQLYGRVLPIHLERVRDDTLRD